MNCWKRDRIKLSHDRKERALLPAARLFVVRAVSGLMAAAVLCIALPLRALASPVLPVEHIYTEDGYIDYNAEETLRRDLPVQTDALPDWPKGPVVTAQSAIVMDVESGAVLYGKNIHEALYPASTTKVMTGLLAFENLSLSDTVTISASAVDAVPWDGSSIGMDPGEVISVEEALYGVFVGSANEVSNALAEKISGSIPAFADLMNARAAELGCENTHFVNANGLHDEEHYTSAYDLALIARAFFASDQRAQIANTPQYHFVATPTQKDDFYLNNKHKLITGEVPCEGIIGGKTGYTGAARETLVTACERGGLRLVCVVMKEESPHQFTDTAALLEYGYANFHRIAVSEIEDRYRHYIPDYFASGEPRDLDPLGRSVPLVEMSSLDTLLLPNTADLSALARRYVTPTDAERAADPRLLSHIQYEYGPLTVGGADLYLTEEALAARAELDEGEDAPIPAPDLLSLTLAEMPGELLRRALTLYMRRTDKGTLILFMPPILITLAAALGLLLVGILTGAFIREFFAPGPRRRRRRR